jgi:uncharacterized protein YkwD
MNVVDAIIVLFLGFSVFDGWRRGLLALLSDLVALALSIVIALQVYLALAPQLSQWLGIPEHGAKILSFFAVAFLLGWALSILFGMLMRFVPPVIRDSIPDKLAGGLFGVAKGLFYIAILLLLFATLPVMQPVKDAIAGSTLAPPITEKAKVYAGQAEGYLRSAFGGLVDDTFSLLTVKPGEGGLDLGFTVTRHRIDERAEEEMLRFLNEERTSRGLVPLRLDERLREAARAHSRDMFERGYFAHDTPEGKTPAERLDERGITYGVMGENLALAPDVALAHRGLMNSPSHRENILFPEYRKVGIGAVNGGIYGIMFSQEFTD